jgi:hypothetical protein
MASAQEQPSGIAWLIRDDVVLLSREAAYVLIALFAAVLLMSALPREHQWLVATTVVWAGPLFTGLVFSLLWQHRLFAFLVACLVAPIFIHLADELVPHAEVPPEPLVYLFASICGAAMAGIGVLSSFAFKRRRRAPAPEVYQAALR